jgi:competence protein ComEA
VSTDPTSLPWQPGCRPSVVDMARRTPTSGAGRLAAVLDPQPSGDDAPTVPIPLGPTSPFPNPVPPVPPRRAGRLAAVADRWLPGSWRTARIDPGRPGALAVVLVGVVAAVVAAVGVWREAPRVEPVPELPALVTTTAAAAAPMSTAAVAETLVVAVAGKVRRPGLVRVPPGSRVADVLDAAGGPLPGADLSGVNLARKVGDGEQVAVGVPPAPDAAQAPVSGGEGGSPSGPLDLNSAGVEQLDGLPGVGPVTAQRIVEWRTRNGRFATVDQLREVEGIGERRFGQLRGLVRV